MLSRPIQIALGVALAATAYVYWQDSSTAEPELESKARPAQKSIKKMASEAAGQAVLNAASSSAASAASTAVASAASVTAGIGIADLFPKQSWAPPPPPTPTPGPPPPTPVPVAPPLPFQVTATWKEKNTLYVVVEGQGQSIVLCTKCDTLGRIQPGETLLGSYRLDKLTPDLLTFTYLPLNQQQSLPTGGTP
ncbi:MULTISPECIES: hypothetical protein [Deefgea]|uniref:Dermaseptin domain-containing protein n=1 Tax=Deefgea chitinilytica TaxID=570276 RepID=A0ABS2CDP3_9NEIS|nr:MULTISPECIES: hypothetical protein [Deefgea]MBM5572284.1 hypothetical protein [Deefgea chitinilytica]MBM9889520.1 hypothetical protein [Deefgea sp. CFH1-16]